MATKKPEEKKDEKKDDHAHPPEKKGTGNAWSYLMLFVIGGFLFGAVAGYLYSQKREIEWVLGLILQYAIVGAILGAFVGYISSLYKKEAH